MKWEEVKIKDIAVVKKGSYITKKEANLGPYPVILGGKEPAYYIDKYNHQGKAIVISRSGASAGFVSFWNEDIFVTDGFLVEPIGDVSYEYMYYLLKSKQDILQILQGGSAIPHVTPTIIYSICVNLPPKDVRERIGKVLKSYDDLIENNQKQIKLLEEAAQRLYKEWFVDLRFPGHEDVEIVDGLPKGWERTTIGKYISVRSGYAFKSDWWQKDGYPVVKIKDITKNTIDLSELDYVGTDKLKKASEFKLNKHDLVIAMTGATIGKIGLVPEVDDLYANQRVGKLFLKDCIANKTGFFFCYYTQSKVLEEILAVSSSSSAQPNISGKQLESFEVVANEEFIDMFNDLVEPYLDKINILRKQIFILKEARDCLLPKLMSGEVEV